MITIDLQHLSDGLMGFYLITAILLLAIAIVVYPSLKERAKRTHK
jgi:hypothetical protein